MVCTIRRTTELAMRTGDQAVQPMNIVTGNYVSSLFQLKKSPQNKVADNALIVILTHVRANMTKRWIHARFGFWVGHMIRARHVSIRFFKLYLFQDLIPSTIEFMNEGSRILSTALIEFALSSFSEFSAFSQDEQVCNVLFIYSSYQ